MTPAFASWSDFFAMGGYALYVWLAVAMSVIPLVVLVLLALLLAGWTLRQLPFEAIATTITALAVDDWLWWILLNAVILTGYLSLPWMGA